MKKALFDPKSFLAKVGAGRTITEYRKNQQIFAQGDPAEPKSAESRSAIK
jgi:CRP/FNR family transcriptional regulator, cyclic AMP receptor protein